MEVVEMVRRNGMAGMGLMVRFEMMVMSFKLGRFLLSGKVMGDDCTGCRCRRIEK